jgi:hypothetical protein
MTPRKRRFAILSVILLIGCAPFISVSIAAAVADAYGCRLDEAAIYPCIIHGRDFGGVLATMSLAGWAGLITIPAAISTLMGWGMALLLRAIWRGRSVFRR